MRKISLQWRLTILTTVLIKVLCGCLTFFLYKNGVYYIDTLQETVTDQGTTQEAVYIDIPDNEWDDFAAQFATKVYNSKSDYRNRSLLITGVVALIGGAVTYFVSGRALKPLREFSETVSATVRTTSFFSLFADTVTVPSTRLYLIAFSTRL